MAIDLHLGINLINKISGKDRNAFPEIFFGSLNEIFDINYNPFESSGISEMAINRRKDIFDSPLSDPLENLITFLKDSLGNFIKQISEELRIPSMDFENIESGQRLRGAIYIWQCNLNKFKECQKTLETL